jgi:calcineurin-like phosphoesterase family protein
LPWATPPEHRRFIKIDGVKIVLDHYTGRSWAGSAHGSIQLFGHSHGRMPANDRSCDVGVDAWQLMPVGIDQIRAYLAKQPSFRNEDLGDDGPDVDLPTPP